MQVYATRKESGGICLVLPTQLAMAMENGFLLDEVECRLLDKLFTELVQNVGAVSAILDCAAAVQPETHERFLRLAREASAEGTLTLKKVLWQWSGFRRHTHEGKVLRAPEATVTVLDADVRKAEAPSDGTLPD
jgi:hypothetical protein